jgi:drug/metabolite transporter (DMT)-like permease
LKAHNDIEQAQKLQRNDEFMGQVTQMIGSVLILAAFAAAQRRWLDQRSKTYLLLNLVGSAVLSAAALIERQWGFLVLEGVWAIVSVAGLIAALRGVVRD